MVADQVVTLINARQQVLHIRVVMITDYVRLRFARCRVRQELFEKRAHVDWAIDTITIGENNK